MPHYHSCVQTVFSPYGNHCWVGSLGSEINTVLFGSHKDRCNLYVQSWMTFFQLCVLCVCVCVCVCVDGWMCAVSSSAGPQMPQPVLINPSGRGPYSCTKSMQLSVEKLSASMLARVPSGQCSDTPPGGVKRAPSQPSDTPLGGVKRAPSQPSDTPLGGVKRAPSQPSSAQPGAKRRCLTHSMYSISVEEEDNDDDGDSSAVKVIIVTLRV